MQEIHSSSLWGSLSLMAPPGDSSSLDLAPNAFDSSRCQNHLWVIHPGYPWRYQKNILQLDCKLFKRNKLCLLTFGSRKLIIVYRLYLGLYCSAICLLDDESDSLAPSELCSNRRDLSLLSLRWALKSAHSHILCADGGAQRSGICCGRVFLLHLGTWDHLEISVNKRTI